MFGQFVSNDEWAAAEAGEIVAIGVADSPDETVHTQVF